MEFLSKLYTFLILFNLFILSQQNHTINESIYDENPYKKNGEGYKCLDKLIDYRQKFSSVKSYILTDKNYANYLKQNKITILYIHSACTQESHDFIPYIKFIGDYYNAITDPDSPKFATMEISDDENNWNNQYNFRSTSYPILILNIKGRRGYMIYNNYHNVHGIITFITKYSNQNIIPMNNTNILQQMLTPQLTHLAIVAFNKKYIKTFERTSKGLSYVLFGDCTGQKLCEEKFGKDIYKYSDFALIKMTHIESDFEESPDNKRLLDKNKKPEIIPYNYTNFQNFKEFIYLNTMPKIFNFTGFNKDLMQATLVNTIIYVRGSQEKKSNEEISKILRKAIDLSNNKIKIGGILDPLNNSNEETLMNYFRLELEDYSVYGNVVIEKYINKERDLYRINIHQVNKDKAITESNVLNFVKEFLEGKLKPELKSENRPKVHPKDNLRMVVGRTFENEITYNNDVAVVLCLLTMNLTNLRQHESLIDTLTMKLDALNTSLIFSFIDVGLNYMENLPKHNYTESPYYRYYYKNKSEGYDDFKGNYSNIEEIEEWIAVNFGKENGKGYDDLVRKYIQSVNEQMRIEEEAKKRKEAEFERDVEAGNLTSFEMIMGDGSNEAINITEQKIQRILKKKIEAEKRKRKEEELKNKTNEYYEKVLKEQQEKNKQETDL